MADTSLFKYFKPEQKSYYKIGDTYYFRESKKLSNGDIVHFSVYVFKDLQGSWRCSCGKPNCRHLEVVKDAEKQDDQTHKN